MGFWNDIEAGHLRPRLSRSNEKVHLPNFTNLFNTVSFPQYVGINETRKSKQASSVHLMPSNPYLMELPIIWSLSHDVGRVNARVTSINILLFKKHLLCFHFRTLLLRNNLLIQQRPTQSFRSPHVLRHIMYPMLRKFSLLTTKNIFVSPLSTHVHRWSKYP